MANKKVMHYKDVVYMPWIRELRKKLGWVEGQPVLKNLKAESWCDGNIPQLQTMLFESREAEDEKERICRNKHSAAATGTQQPADLSPIFRIFKKVASTFTVKEDSAVVLATTIHYLFTTLKKQGLNLNGNYRKKGALIDYLVCSPEMLETALKKNNIKKGFVEGGMIDEATGTVAVFEKLLGTCRRYHCLDSNIRISKNDKDHCRQQFQRLMKIQLKNSQVTYPDMKDAGLPVDIDSGGNEMLEDRPSEPHADHR